MDIFDKYAAIAARHDQVLEAGPDPLAVRMDQIISPTRAMINGRETILVGTNNYLGLTFEPSCIEAAIDALRSQGTGTTGSRIANGTYDLHKQLEADIADFMGMRSAIVFTTGYQANLAMISGLAGPNDVIFVDADWHASIFDGCKLSGAKVIRFKHNDAADLDRRMRRNKDDCECMLVIVEGIYSMLGDRAPLRDLIDVTHKHGGFILVDEAHSLGVLGPNGRGEAEEQGILDQVDFIAGTFSKSLGAIGGYGVSNHPKFDVLRYTSKPYMFTASPSPATIASVIAALKTMREQPQLREQIWHNAQTLYDGLRGHGFEIASPASPIIAVKMPDEATVVQAWNLLLNLGVYVNLAIPPGTPNGVCLLRCSLSAAHTDDEIRTVIDRFGAMAGELRKLAA